VFTTRSQIHEALSRVGRRLALADAGEYALLICGGSALSLAGLVDRPTRDVDVLGLVEGSLDARVLAELLPEAVSRAAQLVAADLSLPEDWLNDSALAIHSLGLPPGILQRARPHQFGPCLTVHVIDRQDQVALKIYAALDGQKGQRHLQDLAALNPTRAEMEFAVRWLLERKTSAAFRHAIRDVCEAVGFRKVGAVSGPKLKPPGRIVKPRRAARASKQPRR
jgi:hypothetical protein